LPKLSSPGLKVVLTTIHLTSDLEAEGIMGKELKESGWKFVMKFGELEIWKKGDMRIFYNPKEDTCGRIWLVDCKE